MAALCTSRHTSAIKNYTYAEAKFANGEHSSSLPNRDAPPAERSRAFQTSYFWHVPAAASNSRTFQSKGLTESIQCDSQVSLSLPHCHLLLHYLTKTSVVLLRWRPNEKSGNCGQGLLQKSGFNSGNRENAEENTNFFATFVWQSVAMMRIVALKDKEPLHEPKQWALASCLTVAICNYEESLLKFTLAPEDSLLVEKNTWARQDSL